MKPIFALLSSLLLVPLFVFFRSSPGHSSNLAPIVENSMSTPRAVIVELFTSEGCSSCPPADALLKSLSEHPSVSGTEIIALEEHVDYWDHLGWKDPFSTSKFTERQNEYARVLGNSGIYTPQMIVDGQSEFVGSRSREAREVIQKAALLPKLNLQLTPATNSANDHATFDIAISNLAVFHTMQEFELWVAITEKNLHTDVKAGENSGERLQHAAVVRHIQKLESIRGPDDHLAHATLKLDPSWQRQNLSFVAFTTEKHSRKITGAATLPIAP
jgi:hypothetical protein